MQKLTALVSGASSFIGSYLCCQLARKGLKVYALSSSEDSKNSEFLEFVKQGKVEFIKGSTLDVNIEDLPKVSYIYHLEGKDDDWGSMKEFAQANVVCTKNMLEYAKLCPKLKCFTLYSSVAVFGFNGYSNLREDAEMLPMNNSYPISKMLAEEEVKKVAEEHKIDYIIIRPGRVYGEFDYDLSYCDCDKIENQKLALLGGGIYESCFVYVGNLIDATIYLSQTKSALNNDYNITDGNNYTSNQYYSMVAKELGIDFKFKNRSAWVIRFKASLIEGFYKLFKLKKRPPITRFVVEQNLHDYSFSMQKTYETKFRCPYTTEEGIARMVAWYNKLTEEKQK